MTDPRTYWPFYRQALRDHLDKDPDGWKYPWLLSTCVATMYVGAGELVSDELFEMKQAGVRVPDLSEWPDDDVTNLLHQRYHLWVWQQSHPGLDLSMLDTIVEYGGGYGAMALVASRYGFRGTYYLHDFPEFLDLQLRHLSLRGLHCEVKAGSITNPDLLISLFGLSETPVDERDAWIKSMRPATYLFGFQGAWGEIDNVAWFQDWAQAYFQRGGPLFELRHHRHHTTYLVSHGSRR